MLTIYDAVAWRTIPPKQPILVYVDGGYITYPDALALEPPMHWTVTTTGESICDIADCEQGNISPARAAVGVALGWWHTVYCSLDTYPAVVSAMMAQGSPRWSWFAADPTGEPHLPPGAAACQYAWHSLGQCPTNYDMSVATEAWVAKTYPKPQPTNPTEENPVNAILMPNGDVRVYAIGAGTRAGQLLRFIDPADGSQASVDDITDTFKDPNPYTVSG